MIKIIKAHNASCVSPTSTGDSHRSQYERPRNYNVDKIDRRNQRKRGKEQEKRKPNASIVF